MPKMVSHFKVSVSIDNLTHCVKLRQFFEDYRINEPKGQFMRILVSLVLIVAVTVISNIAFSAESKKILLVSDVDDTLKMSNVLNKGGAVKQVLNITAVFTGMSQLYQLIVNQYKQDVKVVYLSNAIDGYAGISPIRDLHQNFLSYNKFPEGPLLLRSDIRDKNHKIRELRRLQATENPDVMILFGDNGERDAEIYHQFALENKTKNIKIVSFIHQVYSSVKVSAVDSILGTTLFSEVGKKISPEQFGYVTAIEPALELNKQGLLADVYKNWMVTKIAPYIVRQSRATGLDIIGEATFASFQDCSDFIWKWPVTSDVEPLVKKIKAECK